MAVSRWKKHFKKMKNRKVYKLHIESNQFIQRNKHPFPPGKYWIGSPLRSFDENLKTRLFVQLSSFFNRGWKHDLSFKGHRFACHFQPNGGPYPVFDINTGKELFDFSTGPNLMVCAPKDLVDQEQLKRWNSDTPEAGGWVHFDEEWNVYSTEEESFILLGDYLIDFI